MLRAEQLPVTGSPREAFVVRAPLVARGISGRSARVQEETCSSFASVGAAATCRAAIVGVKVKLPSEATASAPLAVVDGPW